MVETIIKQTIKKNENVKLLKFGVFRTPKGVEIFVQSRYVEEHFKNFGFTEGFENWGDTTPYNIPTFESNNQFQFMFDNWKGGLFISRSENQTPNLSMLRAKGLSEGKRFLVENYIYSQAELRKFARVFREQVTKYFEDYMKPVNVNIEMVFSINESE